MPSVSNRSKPDPLRSIELENLRRNVKMELPKRDVDPNVGKRESSTRKMKTTRMKTTRIKTTRMKTKRMMRKMTTLARNITKSPDLRVVLRRERRVPGIKKTLVLRTPSKLLGNLPKKRVRSLLRKMREKTPRRSLEKAENPSNRRNALKRHLRKKSTSGLMRTSKSTGINSDLRVKSLRGKIAKIIDQKSLDARSPEEKRESLKSLLPVSLSLRLKEDFSELSSLLNDNQSRLAEILAGFY